MARRGVVLLLALAAPAAAAVSYRLTFPEPERRWMQVEATFPDLDEGTPQLHMSRSSPGRYALHEVAKNVARRAHHRRRRRGF